MSCFKIFRAVAKSGTEEALFWHLKLYPFKCLLQHVCMLPGEIKLKTSNSVDLGKMCNAGICGHNYCHIKANMF